MSDSRQAARRTRDSASPGNAWVLAMALVVGSCGGPPEAGGPVPRIATDPFDPDVARLLDALAAAAEENPRDASARGRFGLALEVNQAPRAARTALLQATELDPGEPRWFHHLARVRSRTGDVTGALAAIDEVLRLESYAPAHRCRGDWLLDVGRVEDAESSYRAALLLAPRDAGASVGLARVHLRRGEHRQAIDLLESRVREGARDPHIFQLLGTAHRRSGQIELADRAFALAGSPGDPVWTDPWRDERERYRVGFAADVKRAIGLLSGPRRDEGIRILERHRPQHPDNPALLVNLGVAYCEAGRLEEGIEALEAAVRGGSGGATALVNLSRAYEATGRLPQALETAGIAVETSPELPIVHLRMGQVLGSLGRWPEAAAGFQAALTRDPRMIRAHAGLARARGEAGDLRGAREALRRAETLAPGSPEIPLVRRRLAELERLTEASR